MSLEGGGGPWKLAHLGRSPPPPPLPSPPPPWFRGCASSVAAVAVPQLVCFHVFPDLLFGSSLLSKHSLCFETQPLFRNMDVTATTASYLPQPHTMPRFHAMPMTLPLSQPQLVQNDINSKPCLLGRLLSRASSALSRAGLISPWFHRLHLRHPHTMPPFHAMPRKTYRITVGKEIYVITSWLKSAVAPLHLIPPGSDVGITNSARASQDIPPAHGCVWGVEPRGREKVDCHAHAVFTVPKAPGYRG